MSTHDIDYGEMESVENELPEHRIDELVAEARDALAENLKTAASFDDAVETLKHDYPDDVVEVAAEAELADNDRRFPGRG